MIILVHAVAGSAIGVLVKNPYLSVPIAFGSHFLLDMLPHAQAPTDPGYMPNKKTYIIVAVDVFLSLSLIYFLKSRGALGASVFLPMIAAVLPDILDTTRYNKFFYNKFRVFYDFHDKIQRETNKFGGYLTQILVVLIGLFVLGVL